MRRLKSGRKAISLAEQHRRWLTLRRKGMLEIDIARRFGVTQQAVSKAILKYIRNLSISESEDLRRIEGERLDALLLALAPSIAKGQPRAIEAAVKISERRAKLLGLDAPDTHVIEGPVAMFALPPPGPAVDVEIIRQIQELDPIEKPDDCQTYLVDYSRALPAPSQCGHTEEFEEILVRELESQPNKKAQPSGQRAAQSLTVR